MITSLLALSAALSLQAAQPVDEVATAVIEAETTDPKFLNDWVRTLPEHESVPSPRDVIGYTPGTDGELTHVDDIHRYFRALAEASPRVALYSLGPSDQGGEMLVAAIADEETIRNLDRYKEITNALADPVATSKEEADALIAEGKPIYYVTAGLHSTELGPPEAAMEIAYRLTVTEGELFDRIRSNVITLITPVLEVDGRARQVEWTKAHLSGLTDYNDTPPKSPPFWGNYIFHDNNRDGLVISQQLTRNYVGGFFEWKPTLSLDMHESVPLLYVSGGTGPYNTSVDPITITEWQAIANHEVSRLTGLGMPGVWSWGFYTGWYPGYLLWVTNNHNANGRFYETFGNRMLGTVERDLTRARYAGDKVIDKTWYRADPPERKFDWSMRNNTNYMVSGVFSSLEYVSATPKVFLRNFYQKNVNAMSRAVEEAPYAFVIPAAQTDRNAAEDLVTLLGRHGIEISVANGGGKFGETQVKRGDLIVKLDQRYGPLAQNLLEKQKFPEKVQVSPYDDVAWTLGLQMGVEVTPIDDEDVLDLRSAPLAEDAQPFGRGGISGGGRYVAIPHEGQNELGPLRLGLADAQAVSVREEFRQGGRTFPAGSLIIDTDGMDRNAVADALRVKSLSGYGMGRLPNVETDDLDAPRIALLHSWVSTQNAGWARYTLDSAGVQYTMLDKDRARAGNLRGEFDVIVVPAIRRIGSAADLIAGVDPKWSPLPYKQTTATPSHGFIASADDITGGFGFEGMAEIAKFVNDGGTLIGMHGGGALAAETGLTRTIGISRPGGLNTPGSVLSAKVTGTSPLTYGYDTTTYAFRSNGPLFTVSDNDRDHVALQFGSKIVPEPFEDEKEGGKDEKKKSPLVLSGQILSGKEQMDGAPALLWEKVGDGRVVLFSWNPLHRYINHHDHAFFYNAVLHWNDLN